MCSSSCSGNEKAFHNFFKEAKQLLGLGKCQSNDFDAQIADTTITLIQYILLTLKFRFEHYETYRLLTMNTGGRYPGSSQGYQFLS
jgi:hypothetical protein